MSDWGPLLIPVENQVRELDGKLLLACIAARRGLACVIGAKQELHALAGALPRGLYLAKSLTPRSRRLFAALAGRGHAIAAWDEEALVTFGGPDLYWARRLAPEALRYVSDLFAWGDANAELFRKFPSYPGTPVHVTGNPRGDLLRPELREYFAADVEEHRRQVGDFILVNTNFGQVNAWAPGLNLTVADAHGRPERMGKAAHGMTPSYARGRAAYKQALFEAFQALIPFLHDAFPHHVLVVRPHPNERPDVYHALARDHARVRVALDGRSPVSWLLAARALVHSGCTTGLEAFAVGRPSVAYRPVQDERYEDSLPNRLSHGAASLDEVAERLEAILAGDLGPPAGEAPLRELAHHLAAREGALACDRIVDVATRLLADRRCAPSPGVRQRLSGGMRVAQRRLRKALQPSLRRSRKPEALRRQRYPGIGVDALRARLARLETTLGGSPDLGLRPLSAHVFRIAPVA